MMARGAHHCRASHLNGNSEKITATFAEYTWYVIRGQQCLYEPDTMSVTLHTSVGNIKIEVFCESVPKTAEVDLHRPSLFALHSVDHLHSRISLPSVPPIFTMALPFTAPSPPS